jgi:hypothetical protein
MADPGKTHGFRDVMFAISDVCCDNHQQCGAGKSTLVTSTRHREPVILLRPIRWRMVIADYPAPRLQRDDTRGSTTGRIERSW